MKTVKRFHIYLHRQKIEEDDKGDFVLYSDYCILLDKIKELTKENNDIKSHCYLTGGYD